MRTEDNKPEVICGDIEAYLVNHFGLEALEGRDPDGQPYTLADSVRAIIDGEVAERRRLEGELVNALVHNHEIVPGCPGCEARKTWRESLQPELKT